MWQQAAALLALVDRRGEEVFRATSASYGLGPGRGPAHVISLSPRGGGHEGNITVLVSGTMFHDHGDVRCRFCSIDVPGEVQHHGAITCVVPPFRRFSERAGKPPRLPFGCMVHVSMNGVDYTRRGVGPFLYYNLSHIAIAALRPSGGRRSGGTLVRLRGTGFVDHGGAVQGPKCRFGDLVVPATVTSHEELECVSPAVHTNAPLQVPVWVTLNGYTD